MKKKYATPQEAAAAKQARRRERYATDPEYRAKVRARNEANRVANPEAANEQRRRWTANNPEKSRAIKSRWKSKNTEYLSDYNARRNSTEEQRAYKRRWQAARVRGNLQYGLAQACRDRLCKAIRGRRKSGSTLELIGCSPDELRAHLESQFLAGMTWDNWTTNGWHIDHIKPLASFDLSDHDQQRVAFHYTNLRPLWAVDNLRKGARWEVA